MKVSRLLLSQSRLLLACFTAYLILLFGAVVWFGLQNIRTAGSYNIADWLINYSGGFIRRGLMGEVVLLISRFSHLPLGVVVFILQLALFIVLYTIIWKLVLPLRWHFWTVALAFSPATLGFVALVGGGAFRKDLLFLVALAVLLLALWRGMSDVGIVVFLAAVAVLIALSHEGLIVYWPYLIGAIAISRRSLRTSVRLCWGPTLTLCALAAVVSRHPGDLAHAKAICSSIGSVYTGAESGLCGGSIAYLSRDSAYALGQVVNSVQTNHYLRDYILLFTLSFLPCVMAVVQLSRVPGTQFSIRLLLLSGVTAILCSSTIFIFAVDWGRWIYVHVFCWMMLLFFISGRDEPLQPEREVEWRWSVRGVLSGAILASYLLCWHLPVTGYEGRGWGYIGMARRHLRRLVNHNAAGADTLSVATPALQMAAAKVPSASR